MKSRVIPFYRHRGMSRVALVGVIAGLAIGMFAAVFTWIATKPAFTVSDELDVALRKVLKGDLELANSIAAEHKLEELESDSDKAKKTLIEGVYQWGQAQKSLDHQASFAKAEEALETLKRSEEYGFPVGYEGLGNFALGMVGKFLRKGEESLKPLQTAVVRYPQQRSDAISAIIDILLDKRPPDIEEAQKILDHWMTLPALGQMDRDRAALAKSRILLAEQKISEAIEKAKSLTQDSNSYVGSQLLQAYTLRDLGLKAEEPQREELLEKALAITRELNDSPLPKPAQRRDSLYLTGLILRDLGKPMEALSLFSSIRHGFPETPESLSSGVEEIEIAIEMGQPEQAPVIVSYFNKHLGKPELYISDRFVPEQFRARFVEVGKKLIEKGYLDIASQYARILPEVCTPSDRLRLDAMATRKQAEKIVAEMTSTEGPTGARYHGTGLEKARPYYRSAGRLYDRLAMLELRSAEHSELLWNAIECFQAAHELDRCNELLDLYLNLESRAKRPRALLAKGENQLAAGETAKALTSFKSLIENFDDSPLAYRSRILSAQALGEDLKFDEAREMLLNNLYDGRLTPQSPLWRDSLFQLGSLLFRHGEILNTEARRMAETKADTNQRVQQLELSFTEYQNGIKRLEEALQRFEDDERSYQAQYMLAEAYRKSAQFPRLILDEKLSTTDEKRQQRVQQERDLLTNSMKAFLGLRKKINARSDALELDPHLQIMLRNSYFGEADILFDLKDYTAALNAYRNTANRYRFEPESLEALMRVSVCLEKLEKPKDAKQVVLQALQILKGIPSEKEKRFLEVTPFSRVQWEEHLNWLASSRS